MIVIIKQTKSDKLDLDAVRQDPEQAVTSMLRGWVCVGSAIPNASKRGLYNSNRLGWKRGRHTFTLTCAIPDEEAHRFKRVVLSRDDGCFDEEDYGKFSLGERPALGDYTSISIPPELIPELLPHTTITGGITDDTAPLEELHVGVAVCQRREEARIAREGSMPMAFRR